jgi:hypothetical protein
MLVDSITNTPGAFTEEEKDAIHLQMERLLANPYFSHSRRFPSFLRFVIDHTISGQTDVLKERTLGIEIFGKNADYDTSSDPIVRVTAAEIRKRIAQYYQDPGHEHELRISLLPGSYVPQFHWPSTHSANQADKEEHPSHPTQPIIHEPHPAESSTAIPPIPTHSKAWRTAFLSLAAALTIAAATAALFWNANRRTPFDFFWGPVLKSNDPVLFCIADQSRYGAITLRDAADPTHQITLTDVLTAVIIDDLSPIVRMAGILQSDGKSYSLRGENVTSLSDLRNGPTIFIGAFDNAWTLRLTKNLRYHFANEPDMTRLSIVDGTAPTQTHWTVDRTQQMATNIYSDYAIIARYTDNITGRIAIVTAGIGRGGTIAAGEFLTNPSDLAQLERITRAAGNKKNLEIVLSTQIINGEPGTPKIEAAYFW